MRAATYRPTRVACPGCDARPGDPCVDDGDLVDGVHMARHEVCDDVERLEAAEWRREVFGR